MLLLELEDFLEGLLPDGLAVGARLDVVLEDVQDGVPALLDDLQEQRVGQELGGGGEGVGHAEEGLVAHHGEVVDVGGDPIGAPGVEFENLFSLLSLGAALDGVLLVELLVCKGVSNAAAELGEH